jgi:hypothetical protein
MLTLGIVKKGEVPEEAVLTEVTAHCKMLPTHPCPILFSTGVRRHICEHDDCSIEIQSIREILVHADIAEYNFEFDLL